MSTKKRTPTKSKSTPKKTVKTPTKSSDLPGDIIKAIGQICEDSSLCSLSALNSRYKNLLRNQTDARRGQRFVLDFGNLRYTLSHCQPHFVSLNGYCLHSIPEIFNFLFGFEGHLQFVLRDSIRAMDSSEMSRAASFLSEINNFRMKYKRHFSVPRHWGKPLL